MEIIRGKRDTHVNRASFMDQSELMESVRGYNFIHLDLGTGDGRFVQHMAQAHPNDFIIGLDACRENLRQVSSRAPSNALFVIANAETLPHELYGMASRITINFPWGSLLEGLLESDSPVLTGLEAVARPKAPLEIRLNGGALSEAGWSLEAGADRIRAGLIANGFRVRSTTLLTAHELKSFPTTWAKKLAFGRDPRAMYLSAVKG
ncbi:MAG TPA: class I SAM-dependent methyltransferase [Phototrophicaceae bacterium]|nr:class I SAM-dependent methyltransferase [Phototrophicaceae bacterium]